MAEYTIGVCPTCGGISHLDKPCLTHPEHTEARRIVKVCDVAERDDLREALERIVGLDEEYGEETAAGEIAAAALEPEAGRG